MLGGFSFNMSGPCYRPDYVLKVAFDELTVDCHRLDMVIARCTVPVNEMFRTGVVDVILSVDGGRTWPFWSTFVVCKR